MQRYILFLLLFCPLCFGAIAQPALPTNGLPGPGTPAAPVVYRYYLLIEGIHTPDDVWKIAKKVVDKPVVLQFAIDDYPVSYFIIRSEVKITEAEFREWIHGLPYTLKQMEGDDVRRLEEMLAPIIRRKQQGH